MSHWRNPTLDLVQRLNSRRAHCSFRRGWIFQRKDSRSFSQDTPDGFDLFFEFRRGALPSFERSSGHQQHWSVHFVQRHSYIQLNNPGKCSFDVIKRTNLWFEWDQVRLYLRPITIADRWKFSVPAVPSSNCWVRNVHLCRIIDSMIVWHWWTRNDWDEQVWRAFWGILRTCFIIHENNSNNFIYYLIRTFPLH